MTTDELTRLRAELRDARQAAHTAQAALDEVRRLCQLTIKVSCRVQAIDQAHDTLAVIDSALAKGAKPYRALITGSRDWDDVTAIGAALEQALIDAGPRPVVVVHGACPSGADWHADHYARWMRGQGVAIDVEQHPAQSHPTEDFGPWPGAGPRRNAHMVGLGADVLLAFVGPCSSSRCRKPQPHPSHGTSCCIALAEQAGIPVRRWTA
ncbi:SLOG family protein [Streptomyces asiaticus]